MSPHQLNAYGFSHSGDDARIAPWHVRGTSSRHEFASLMVAAGVNARALSTIMSHATIAMTFDTY